MLGFLFGDLGGRGVGEGEREEEIFLSLFVYLLILFMKINSSTARSSCIVEFPSKGEFGGWKLAGAQTSSENYILRTAQKEEKKQNPENI